MTETELKAIEVGLPKGADRVGANLATSQLAAEVRNAWSEGAQLRQGLSDIRNSGARLAHEREAAGAMAERYRAERDELVERCGRFRKMLAELLLGLEGGPGSDAATADTVTRARRLLNDLY